jgi:hypothetical protein
MNLNYFTENQVLEAIKQSRGLVATVAKILNCSWITAENYIKNWDSTKAAMKDEKETYIDHVESKAMDLVDALDGPMIRYYLSTQGRKRGYAERYEITGADGKPLEFSNVDSVKKNIIDRFSKETPEPIENKEGNGEA